MSLFRRFVSLTLVLSPLALTGTGCQPTLTEADCHEVRPGESKDDVDDDLGHVNSPETGDPRTVQYGGCGRHSTGGVCCVTYDGERVLGAMWSHGCSCAGW